MRSRKNVTLVLIGLLAMLLAACGGDSAPPTPIVVTATPQPQTGAPTTQAQPTQAQGGSSTTPESQSDTKQPTLAPGGAKPTGESEQPGAELTTQQLYEKLRDSTVRVLATFGENALRYETIGSGTGIVYDLKNGYIITNAHVVEGAASVKVATDNSSDMRPVKVVGRAACDDIAILKVLNTRGLTEAKLGSSDALTPGQRVTVLGYPRSLDVGGIKLSVSSGEVAVLNQQLDIWQDLIRHNAATNPGNSGGPLVNAQGEVVGIHSAGDKSGQGLNFAISIDYAKPIIQELEGGKNRDYVGLNLVPNEYEEVFGTDQGLVVAAVSSGSPASHVGIQPEDLLLKLEDTTLASQAQACDILRSHNDGDAVKAQVFRLSTGDVLEGEVYIGKAPGSARKIRVTGNVNPTPEPQPTASPEPQPTEPQPTEPAPTGGEFTPILQTNFDDNQPGSWSVEDGDDFTADVRNGRYVIALAADATYISTSPEVKQLADGGVATKVTLEGSGIAGVVARTSRLESGDVQGYMCYIDNERKFGCLKRLNGEWVALVEAKTSEVIKPGGENELGLAMTGDNYTFIINEQIVVEGADKSFDKGDWGIYAESLAGDFTAAYNEIGIFKRDGSAAAPTPPPTSDELYSFDFSQPSDVWTQSKDKFGSRAYVNGKYRITATKAAEPVVSVAGDVLDDIVVEVDIEQVDKKQNTYGLVCRYRDEQNYYGFVIYGDSGIIAKWTDEPGGAGVPIAHGSLGAALRDGVNRIRVECSGQTLTMYVNDKEIATVQDGAWTTGKVGMMVVPNEPPSTVDFDNMVWREP